MDNQTNSPSSVSSIANPSFKRNTANKLRIGQILSGKPALDGDRLNHVEVNSKQVVRVNLIANVIDKFIQEGEKKFGSLTMDDATGQIKLKLFGDDVDKFSPLNQGDTLLVIGLLRFWNNEVYITPEIMKKKDPAFLLVRKIEIERETPVVEPSREALTQLKDKIVTMIKDSEKDGGLDIEKMIMDLKESPDVINKEVKHLLEEGVAYEPRPGKIRWLG
jgi:RecG-like helicase